MTDYSELAKRLRASELWTRHERDGFRPDGTPFEAADALEAQAKRIAELEVPLCIGRRTIGIMAEEGAWQSENGRAVVAADELFKRDPYARIAELEAALKPFADIADLYEDTEEGNKICVPIGDFRAARAALGEKE